MEAALGNHDKHVFVFSTAGKPIYSYHGNEESLSELMATAQALISVALSKGESLRYMRCVKLHHHGNLDACSLDSLQRRPSSL